MRLPTQENHIPFDAIPFLTFVILGSGLALAIYDRLTIPNND
ncbi:MAG: hypothetical protein AAGJ87_11030 [Pseudomonadota bacterium]